MALTKIGKEGITGISNSSDANAITIDSSERVGIGTTSPDEKLDVRGSLQVGVDGTTAGLIRLMDSGSVTEEATISTDANGGLIFGGNSGPGELIFRTGSSTERMRIDSDGYVTQSKLPMFNVIGGSHTIAATGQTTITSSNGFGGLEYDPDNLFNPTNGRFTAPVAGRYFFIFSIGIQFTSGYHYSYLFKNGAFISGLNRNAPQSSYLQTVSIQAVLNLAAGDYVTAERNNNNISGGVDGAMFSGFLLG
jgi:hypothetical protein